MPHIRYPNTWQPHQREKPSKPLVLKTYQAYIQETIGLQGMEMAFKGVRGCGGQNHVPWDPAWELQFEKHLDHK